MTSNFDNDYLSSPTMREYLRITASKSPAPPIQKTAAKEPEPTNFSESLLLLTAKLRDQGFTKHASELEQRFLLLKKAERHMYNVHDETGEDFIEFAHPGGGNKDLDKGWKELGEIETIVEKHKKMLEVVNKTPPKASPTKAASEMAKAKAPKLSVASIAKVILAQDASSQNDKSYQLKDHSYLQTMTQDQLLQKLVAQKDTLKRNIDWLNGLVKDRGGITWHRSPDYDALAAKVEELFDGHMNVQKLSEMRSYIIDMQSLVQNTLGNDEEVKKVAPDFGVVLKRIDWLVEDVKHFNANQTSHSGSPEGGAGDVAKPAEAAPASGTISYEAALKPGVDLDTAFSSGTQGANAAMFELNGFRTMKKAGNDPAKTDMLNKTEAAVRTFMDDLRALYTEMKKPGANFAIAAAKTTAFKDLKTIDQLPGDIKEFLAGVEQLLGQMKAW